VKSFISSTFRDLREFRDAAIRTLERLGAVYAMEKFFASDHRPKDECLAMLHDSNVMILIVGENYGTIDEETGYSITELEYRAAVEAHIPVLPFLKVDETGRWSSAEAGDRKDKHETFKALVGGEDLYGRFVTPEDLTAEILLAIREHERRHGLLGARVSAFQPPDEFFAPFDDPTTIFTHALPLVGREDYLAQIEAFSKSPKRIVILPGRGGLGKSKILKEALLRVSGSDGAPAVRMLRDLNRFEREMANDLPAGTVLIVVDDAHRMRDLATLLAVTREYSDRMQLALATRPQGLPAIRRLLRDARVSPEEILELPELPPLAAADTLTLAREILPNEMASNTDRLVRVTGDSPLATVVGAQLLVQQEIDPEQLVQADEAKRVIFDRFEDVQLGELSEELDRDLARQIVELVSAVGPFRLQHEALVERAATFLGIAPHDLRRALVLLKESGGLVEVDNAFRVTPDLLSEHILQKASVMPSGASTGFTDRIFAHFQEVGLDSFLTNLLNVQPEKVLEFARAFVATHDLEVPDVTFEEAFRGYLTNPIRELPAILLRLAADAHYLGEVLDVLWLLGRADKRPPHQYPEHPIRVLEDLATIRADKHPETYDAVLRAVRRWVGEPDAFAHRYSPLAILDKVLDREHVWVPSEWRRANPFEPGVSAVNVAEVRRRGIRMLRDLTSSADLVVQFQALGSLLAAMWSPEELWVQGDEGEVRRAENAEIAEAICDLLATSESPLVAYTVEERVRAMRPGAAGEADALFRELIAAAPQDLDSRLVRYLRYGQVQRLFFPEEARLGLEPLHEAISHDISAVVQQLIDRERNAQAIKTRLERELEQIAQYGAEAKPREVLSVLAREHSAMAAPFAELLVNDPGSVLAASLDELLAPMRDLDPAAYQRIVEAALATADQVLLTAISHLLYRVGPLEPWERQAVQTLADARLPEIVPNIIRALRRFSAEAWPEALLVVAKLEIDADPDLADEFIDAFVGLFAPHPDPLPEDAYRVLLPKLVPVRRVGEQGSATHDLLAGLAVQDPERIVEFFLDRIRFATQQRREGNRDHDPVPSRASFDLDQADPEARYRALARIADTMAYPPPGFYTYFLDELYVLMANGFDDLSVRVLEELVVREGRYGVEAAVYLLRQAPNGFVFERVEFLDHLLTAASAAGAEVLADVHHSLFTIAWAMPPFVPGAPAPQPTVEARNRAQEVAAGQPEGSLVRAFHEELVRASEAQIEFWRTLR
jgi:hypothetical protein